MCHLFSDWLRGVQRYFLIFMVANGVMLGPGDSHPRQPCPPQAIPSILHRPLGPDLTPFGTRKILKDLHTSLNQSEKRWHTKDLRDSISYFYD